MCVCVCQCAVLFACIVTLCTWEWLLLCPSTCAACSTAPHLYHTTAVSASDTSHTTPHTHTPTPTHPHTYTPTHPHTHTPTPTHPHTPTHTHTHTHTHTVLEYTLPCPASNLTAAALHLHHCCLQRTRPLE